jgi:hypothetical protein
MLHFLGQDERVDFPVTFDAKLALRSHQRVQQVAQRGPNVRSGGERVVQHFRVVQEPDEQNVGDGESEKTLRGSSDSLSVYVGTMEARRTASRWS